eukprot:scaffold93814_cov31-Tisochrysis_lutea.AAC.2
MHTPVARLLRILAPCVVTCLGLVVVEVDLRVALHLPAAVVVHVEHIGAAAHLGCRAGLPGYLSCRERVSVTQPRQDVRGVAVLKGGLELVAEESGCRWRIEPCAHRRGARTAPGARRRGGRRRPLVPAA